MSTVGAKRATMLEPTMHKLVTLLSLCGAACTTTVIPPGAAPDGGSDVAVVDAPINLPRDAVSAGDAVTATDVPVTPDAPAMDLSGRWRVVRYSFTGMQGERITATDTPSIFTQPMTGQMIPIRTNGYLRLTPQRFAMSVALLINDHIQGTEVQMEMDQFTANGFAVPGLLDSAAGRFAVVGGQANYILRALSSSRMELEFGPNGPQLELERSEMLAGAARINQVGGVERLRFASQRPLTRPRVALFWVRPMERSLIESNGVALRFMQNWAAFPLVLADAPAEEARYALGGVPLATAMIVVYDDTNDNRVMDLAAGDSLRGISRLPLVWRGAGGDPDAAAFRQSAFAELGEGYHYAWRARDASTGGVTLLPFDSVIPVSPDAPVSPTELDPLLLESAWR